MRRLFLIALLFLLVLPIHAQDEDTGNTEEDPFITALRMIPDTVLARGQDREQGEYISFLNHRAVESSRENAYTPANAAELVEWRTEADDDPLRRYDHWLHAQRRVNSGSVDLRYAFQVIEDVPGKVGFDFFDIDASLYFGTPPVTANIYVGDFDADAIGEAHAARDYTETTLSGVLTWMTPGGIEEATTPNLEERNPANIFDTRLGRQPPVLIGETGIASAFSPDLITQLGQTMGDEIPSLYDAPDVRALADALLSYDATLIQNHLFGIEAMDYEGAYLLDSLNPDNPILPEDMADYSVLPHYEMVGIADMDTGEEQIAVVALLYLTEDTATIAAEEMENRLQTMTAMNSEPAIPLFATYEGEPTRFESRVYTGEDYAVALVGIYYPRVQEEILSFTELEPDSNTVISGGLLYQRMVQAWNYRTFYALSNIN